MMKHRKLLAILLLILLTSLIGVVQAQELPVSVIAGFEVNEVFEGRDQYNNAIGHAPWGDVAGNVQLSLAQMERVDVNSSVLEINYDIGGWGGFTHAFTDGENWLSQDWTSQDALRFWLYGNNTGGKIQVEIFDNRNANLNGDSAERWYYRIADDYEGWQEFTTAFRSFQRRTDWQPGGAPNDGLGLSEVSGYAFGFPAGAGAQTAYLDDVQLVTLGVDPLVIDDFEQNELFSGQDSFSNDIGHVTWGDTPGNVELRLTDAKLSGQDTRALNINYDIGAWGGFTHVFNDGENWVGQNWSDYNAISLWFLGSNTGAEVQFKIFDNRNPDLDGDSAERYFARFPDDSYGWQQVEIPFEAFQRRSDWQPEGAPDDGFNLDAVSGYAFGLPAGTGGSFAIIDDVRLIFLAGVSMPALTEPPTEDAASAELTVAVQAEVALNEALLEPMAYAYPLLVTGFEDGVKYVSQVDGAAIGFVPWGDSTANSIIGITQALPFTDLAIPESSAPTQLLRIDYNIGARVVSRMPLATGYAGSARTGPSITPSASGSTATTPGRSFKSNSSITGCPIAMPIRPSVSSCILSTITRAGRRSPYPLPFSNGAAIGNPPARPMTASILTQFGVMPLASRPMLAPKPPIWKTSKSWWLKIRLKSKEAIKAA